MSSANNGIDDIVLKAVKLISTRRCRFFHYLKQCNHSSMFRTNALRREVRSDFGDSNA